MRDPVPDMKLVIALVVIAATAFVGYSLGKGRERLRNDDQYVYPFSQYSHHLRELVETQQFGELTNNIVLFDSKFNPSRDPRELQDAVLRILKLGKYYEDTNATRSTHGTP